MWSSLTVARRQAAPLLRRTLPSSSSPTRFVRPHGFGFARALSLASPLAPRPRNTLTPARQLQALPPPPLVSLARGLAGAGWKKELKGKRKSYGMQHQKTKNSLDSLNRKKEESEEDGVPKFKIRTLVSEIFMITGSGIASGLSITGGMNAAEIMAEQNGWATFDPMLTMILRGQFTMGGTVLCYWAMHKLINKLILKVKEEPPPVTPTKNYNVYLVAVLVGLLFVASHFIMDLLITTVEEPTLVTLAAGGKLKYLIHIAVANPILEELLFRWMIFARLMASSGAVPAYLFSSALFGVMHYGEASAKVVNATLGGALFCVAYHMSGSIMAPIIIHCGCNVLSVWVCYTLGPLPLEPEKKAERDKKFALAVNMMIGSEGTQLWLRRLLSTGFFSFFHSDLIKNGLFAPDATPTEALDAELHEWYLAAVKHHKTAESFMTPLMMKLPGLSSPLVGSLDLLRGNYAERLPYLTPAEFEASTHEYKEHMHTYVKDLMHTFTTKYLQERGGGDCCEGSGRMLTEAEFKQVMTNFALNNGNLFSSLIADAHATSFDALVGDKLSLATVTSQFISEEDPRRPPETRPWMGVEELEGGQEELEEDERRPLVPYPDDHTGALAVEAPHKRS